MSERVRGTRIVVVVLVAWLLVAFIVGASGRLQGLQPPAPQLVLVALTVALLLTLRFVGPVRHWASVVDVRWLVGAHLTRFVGIYFLVLYDRGELPYAFAVPRGWGDIIVATLALLLIATGPPQGSRRLLFLIWNVIGLLDILFVVVTATRLALGDVSSMAPLLRLPLSLLPTFVVPIIIATHVWLFTRLIGPRHEPRRRDPVAG